MKDPTIKFLLPGFWFLIFLSPLTLQSQIDHTLAKDNTSDIEYSLTATGQSSGHIADLNILNWQSTEFRITLPASIVSSDGVTQGFVIPQPIECQIPAFENISIPINGYCIDKALPTPPVGKAMPVPKQWKRMPHLPNNPFDKDLADSIRIHTGSDSLAHKPVGATGTAMSDILPKVNSTPDIRDIGSETAHTDHARGNYVSRTPEEDARLIEEAGKIIRSVDSLQHKNSLKTPPGRMPDVEKSVIIQQTIWVASGTPDKPYTMADICNDIAETWSTVTGSEDVMSTSDLSDIIGAIYNTGSGAGISEFLPSPQPSNAGAPPSLPSSGHQIEQNIKVTGTGRTTGHIADLTLHNPTESPVMARVGTGQLYIPSSGKYQPYIVPDLPPVSLAPGEKKTVPVYGYCADIHVPPVPSGSDMPDILDWTSVPVSHPEDMSNQIVTIPTRISQPVDDAIRIISQYTPTVFTGTDPDCIPTLGDLPHTSVIPGTSFPLPNPGGFLTTDDASLLAPILITTLERITDAYDHLREKGAIHTPFSGNESREKEAVVQQTLWIYTAGMNSDTYEKKDFLETTIRQFEDNTNREFESLAPEQKGQVESGVNDFWNSFQAVGVEAKVIRIQDPAPSEVPMDVWSDYPASRQKQPHSTSTDSRTTSPVVPPVEKPLVPPEAEEECIPQISKDAAPAMQGGLNPNSVGTFRVARGELIPLVAEGADADQIIFDCIPKNGCPETGSQRKEGLTSEVRFEWFVREGDIGLKSFYGNQPRNETSYKCTLVSLPQKTDMEWRAGFTDKYSIDLIIHDAMPNQPVDASVVNKISVISSRQSGDPSDSLTVTIIGNSFTTYSNPARIVSVGTCNAEPLNWTVPVAFKVISDDLTLASGEKGFLTAQAYDTDDLSIRCDSKCESAPKSYTYNDEVIFHWEILGESGWFLEGPNAPVKSTFGKAVVFLAPSHQGNEPLSIPVKVTAYNQGGGKDPYNRSPVISKANDPVSIEEITITIPCYQGKNNSPAQVLIGWTDHFLDHDLLPSSIETLRDAKTSVLLEIIPQACNIRLATDDPSHEQDLAPESGNIYVSQMEIYKTGNTLYLIDAGIIIDPGIIQATEDDIKSLRVFADFYATATMMGLSNGQLPSSISSEPLDSPLPASSSWAEQTFWFQTVFFDRLLKSWSANDYMNTAELGLIISIWAVTSSQVNCNEACPASVEHVTMMKLGDEDHFYKRNSDVIITTYVNNVPKIEMLSFKTEKKGTRHP